PTAQLFGLTLAKRSPRTSRASGRRISEKFCLRTSPNYTVSKWILRVNPVFSRREHANMKKSARSPRGTRQARRDPAADQAFSRTGDQRRAITAADCCKVRRATSPTLIVIFKPALFLRCPAFLTKVFK